MTASRGCVRRLCKDNCCSMCTQTITSTLCPVCVTVDNVRLPVVCHVSYACAAAKTQVCPCICFCNYLEQQLQEMHDTAEILMGRILEEQQHQLQEQEQPAALANGNGNGAVHDDAQQQPWLSQQQQHRASANGGGAAHHQQRQQQHRASDTAAFGALVAAATTKLRVLARPISDFSSCRREWVLKLGKAVAMGFMQKAAGNLVR